VGLTYNVDQVRRTTTFRAHQLLHLAGDPAHGGASRRHSAVLESLIHGAKKQQFFVDALRLQAAA